MKPYLKVVQLKAKLAYPNAEHISLEMLNKAYGDKGRTFPTKEKAEAFAHKHPGSIITRLFDYDHRDVSFVKSPTGLGGKVVVKEGAKKKTIAWLVSMPIPDYRQKWRKR